MVDALLDFTGAEARTLRPDRQPTDLKVLTAQTASMFRVGRRTRRADLHGGRSRPAGDRRSRPGMWATTVTNLVSNAVKYTRRGGIRISLDVTQRRRC